MMRICSFYFLIFKLLLKLSSDPFPKLFKGCFISIHQNTYTVDFSARKIMKIVVPSNNTIDNAICHAGTPKGILAIMATGDVNGMIDNQKPNGPSGLFIKVKLPYIPNVSGKIANKVNCCVSVSLSTAEPMAAYTEL